MAGLIKRGKKYYAVYYEGKRQKRVSLETESLQVAKEKLRQLESALYRGDTSPLPTKTPIAQVVAAYIEQMLAQKTACSVIRDCYYLRETFGPVCPALVIKNAKISARGKKRPTRFVPEYLTAPCFEQLTTAQFSTFIASQVRRKALSPKTANRFREVLTRLCNWAMKLYGLRVPGEKNPAAQVERYRERAPEISFLSLEQIEAQLQALAGQPYLQVIVAVYIYAGLRREELCWLTADDLNFAAGVNGMIRVRAKTVAGQFWEPKTKVNRVVPISRALKAYLDAYLRPTADTPWFFPTPHGKRWDPDNLSRALRAANKAAGLNWTCLDYRHTFGSQLAQKGESLYKIAMLMGNSPEICRRHYAALVPECLVDTVEFPGQPAVIEARPPEPPPSLDPAPAVPALRLVVNNR